MSRVQVKALLDEKDDKVFQIREYHLMIGIFST